MRTCLISSAVIVVLTFATVTSARAQESSAPSLSDDQQQEFNRWMEAETAWRHWIEQHGNVADRNWMGMTSRNWIGLPADRKERPTPPAWLEEYCGGLTTSQVEVSDTCRTYEEAITYDWLAASLKQQLSGGRKSEKPEHSVFNFKRHWGFGLGYDNRMIHGSVGMQMTIAEWGRWNYGTLGASLGFMRTSTLDRNTEQPVTKNELSLFVTLGSASYRIKYVKSLGMFWYVDFAQIYDMNHSVMGSQFGFSLSKK